MSDAAAAPKRGATIAIIAAVAIGLSVADRFLADVEAKEFEASARNAYVKGARLLDEGHPAAAIESLRNALAAERDNPEYALQLVQALIAAGKTTEAKPLLAATLDERPNDGRANLMAARIASADGQFDEAQAYYHRAIYGQWGKGAQAHRDAVRMELIKLLMERNEKQQLLGELISLEAQASSDRDTQMRLAAWFMEAGSPARAASIYRSIAEQDPNDVAVEEALGRAEMQDGRFEAAHQAFERAFFRNPGNARVRSELETLNTVTGLDPTIRRLTSAEKYRRSLRILGMAREQLDACAGSHALSPEREQLLRAADAEIKAAMPARPTNEESEAVLQIAQQVWQAARSCRGKPLPDDNPLALLMRKLGS